MPDLDPSEERRLSAILAADVVGFSRLMGDDEAGTFTLVKRLYNEIIQPQVFQHRGRVFKTMGDGFLIEFASAVDSLRCAIAIQKELSVWSSEGPGKGMQLRIGINLGDIIVDGEDVFGSGVNIAARVEPMAEPGGICVTSSLYEHLKPVADVEYEDTGEQSFKNISEPIRVYRIRSEGIASASIDTKPASKGERKFSLLFLLFGVISLLLIVIGGLFLLLKKGDSGSAQGGQPVIAVRMLKAVGDEKQTRLFGEGLTEDVITALSRVPELSVLDQAIVQDAERKTTDSRVLAKSLGVSHVLEGSVASEADDLRINVRLIDAKSAGNLWAERYDRKATHLFDLRDEITLNVISALNVNLVDGQVGELRRRATGNLAAWLLHREALSHAFKFTNSDNTIAKELFGKALELDPKFVTAYVDLGWRHWADASNEWSASPGDSLDKAQSLAQKARELDALNASVYGLIAGIHRLKGEYEDAVKAAKQGVELAPQSAEIHASYADNLVYAGYPELAIIAAKRSLELAPQSPAWYQLALAKSYHLLGNREAAITHHQEYLSKSSKGRWAAVTHLNLAVIYAELDRPNAARAEIEKVKQADPEMTLERFERQSLFKDKVYLAKFVSQLRELDKDGVLLQ